MLSDRLPFMSSQQSLHRKHWVCIQDCTKPISPLIPRLSVTAASRQLVLWERFSHLLIKSKTRKWFPNLQTEIDRLGGFHRIEGALDLVLQILSKIGDIFSSLIEIV